MEIINKMMMVSDSPINEDNKGKERFVVCEMEGRYVAEHSITKKPSIYKYASPILEPKPQWESAEELKNHLDVWEYDYDIKTGFWRRTDEDLEESLVYLNKRENRATEIREIANPENRFLLRDCIIKKAKRLMNKQELIELIKENPQLRVSYDKKGFWSLDYNDLKNLTTMFYTLDLGETWNDFYVGGEA